MSWMIEDDVSPYLRHTIKCGNLGSHSRYAIPQEGLAHAILAAFAAHTYEPVIFLAPISSIIMVAEGRKGRKNSTVAPGNVCKCPQ